MPNGMDAGNFNELHVLAPVELAYFARSVICMLIITVARHGWLNV